MQATADALKRNGQHNWHGPGAVKKWSPPRQASLSVLIFSSQQYRGQREIRRTCDSIILEATGAVASPRCRRVPHSLMKPADEPAVGLATVDLKPPRPGLVNVDAKPHLTQPRSAGKSGSGSTGLWEDALTKWATDGGRCTMKSVRKGWPG